jgi:hypothetical protein
MDKDDFICVGCGEKRSIADGYTNEVVFQREAVARCVKEMLKAGQRVNGLMAILACW